MSQLLQRCQERDPAAIEALVRAHQDAVYRLACSLLGDPAEADEAAQDTFLEALKSLGTYRGQAAFSTWLYAISVNVCRMRRRKLWSWARIKRAVSQAFSQEAPPQPEAAALQAEAEAALWRAVQKLGERHRMPILLRYYHGLSVAEIAQAGGKIGLAGSRTGIHT